MMNNNLDGTLVIAPKGRLVHGELGDLGRVEQAFGRKPNRIVLDLSKVWKMDCAALGTIAGLYALALENGTSLRLLNPTPRIRDLLVVTRLADILPVVHEMEKEQAAAVG